MKNQKIFAIIAFKEIETRKSKYEQTQINQIKKIKKNNNLKFQFNHYLDGTLQTPIFSDQKLENTSEINELIENKIYETLEKYDAQKNQHKFVPYFIFFTI